MKGSRRLRSSASLIDRWTQIEYAAWEDSGCPDGESAVDFSRVYGFACAILMRHKTVIEIRTPDEARALLASVDYWGEPGANDPTAWHPNSAAALRRLRPRLRVALEALKGERE